MLYRNDFYEHCHQFAPADRTAAYARATEVSNRGLKVCITVSPTHYTLWVEMRSQQASASADLAGPELTAA